jgi:hypothetical protein
MRGRLPSGPEYVEQLEGSATAKERVKVILETMAGTCRVQEACQRLGISEPRFEQLRIQILQAALERLEPRPAGRPAQTTTPADERIDVLEGQIAELQMKLQVAQTRTEIALALPGALQKPKGSQAESTTPAVTHGEAANTEANNAEVPTAGKKKRAGARRPEHQLRGRARETLAESLQPEDGHRP